MNTKAVKAILRLIADAESAGSVEIYHAELLAVMAAASACEVVVFNEFQISARRDPHSTPTLTCSTPPPSSRRAQSPPSGARRSCVACSGTR